MITNAKKKFNHSTFHAKFAESFNIKDSVIPDLDRALPDTYHALLGQKLDPTKSKVYKKINEIKDYSDENEMKMNLGKTKFMLFNPTLKYDFVPNLEVNNTKLETMEEMKLLGLRIRNDLSWKSNTKSMVQRAYQKLWMIKRLKRQGANLDDLTDIYVKQVRSILEFGVPVWNSGLTQEEMSDIERVQKSFLYIVLGDDFLDYENALSESNLEMLSSRRTKLCKSFALKTSKHIKHHHWFVKTEPGPFTRSEKPAFKPPLCRLTRLKKSPIPYLTSLLNTFKKK